MLTFDDGYIDHHRHVFPLLRRLGMTGAFFPPSCAVLERRVLDVNKVHFILASVTDPAPLVGAIEEGVEAAKEELALEPLAHYRARYSVASRFDPAEVMYVKRMLQVGLPAPLRARLTDALFRRWVTADASSFADELYVSRSQLSEMVEAGMEVGSHGHAHLWLDHLSAAEQAQDIDRSLELLDAVGVGRRDFLFCYPFGAYDAHTLEVLSTRGCAAAVTTRVALATPSCETLLELPRLDTNDLPRDAP